MVCNKGLLIRFTDSSQIGVILNLWENLQCDWANFNSGAENGFKPLPEPFLIAEDGWSYVILKAEECSVDDVVEVGYDAAWEILKHCVVNGFK